MEERKSIERTTIVGGQPFDGKQTFSGNNIEKILARASEDEDFKNSLLYDRKTFLKNSEIFLNKQDKKILETIPLLTLNSMIEKFTYQRSSRRNFLKGAAASVAFLVTGMVLSSCVDNSNKIKSSPLCEANLKKINRALELYAEDNDGLYPDKLQVLIQVPPGKSEGYLKEIPGCDMCEEPYYYSIIHNEYFLRCPYHTPVPTMPAITGTRP